MKAEEVRAMSEASLKEITIDTYAGHVEVRIPTETSYMSREMIGIKW